MLNPKICGVLILAPLLFIQCAKEPNLAEKKLKYVATNEDAKIWIKSNQLFKPLPGYSDKSEITFAKVKLGKLLYFDKRLSKNGTVSCNSCHNLDTYGVDNQPTSTGDEGQKGGRNSPTSFNAFLHGSQFWDGRAKDVEAQAKGPILNPIEMGIPHEGFLLERLKSVPLYHTLFRDAFPGQRDPITYDNLANAIGIYERTLITPSRFDKFLESDVEALTVQEKQGLKKFIEVGCPTCHMGVAVGGNSFRVFGEKNEYWKHTLSTKIDKGMFELTGDVADLYKFKVPSLRNIEKTHPYFHDGSVNDLEKAVQIMAKTQLDKDLSDEEIKSITAFLKTLTGEVPAGARL